MEHSVSYIDTLTSDIIDSFRRPGSICKVEPLKEKYGSEAVEHKLDALIKSGKLVPSSSETREHPQSVKATYKPGINLNVNISQHCNMHCKYCYANGGTYGDPSQMNEEIGQKTVDFLFRESMEREEKRLGLNFFGGEPLLNMPLLRKMTGYIREQEKKFDRTVDLSITTNGTLMNEECVRYLDEEKIRVTVSIDGPKAIHDRMRVIRNGDSSYEAVMAGLSLLKAHGIETTARVTVTPHNVRFSGICKHLLEAGFDTVRFSPASDVTGEFNLRREDFRTLGNELDVIGQDFLEKLFENKKLTLTNFLGPLARVSARHRGHSPCDAGSLLVAITTKGDIFPCPRFVEIQEYKLGNIFDGINRKRQEDFMEYADVDTRDKCKDCWARYICGGECYYLSVIHTGGLKTTSEVHCHYYRCLAETSLALYAAITEKCGNSLLNFLMLFQTPLVTRPFSKQEGNS
jgi:uncharacterized protein